MSRTIHTRRCLGEQVSWYARRLGQAEREDQLGLATGFDGTSITQPSPLLVWTLVGRGPLTRDT